MDRPRWKIVQIYVSGLRKRRFDFFKINNAAIFSKKNNEKQQSPQDMILNSLKNDLLQNNEQDGGDPDDSLAEEAMQNEADFFKQLFGGMVALTD